MAGVYEVNQLEMENLAITAPTARTYDTFNPNAVAGDSYAGDYNSADPTKPILDNPYGTYNYNVDTNGGYSMDDEKYEQRKRDKDSMFFTKCTERKRIDYVLVYEESGALDPRRKEYEDGLLASGLELEYEDKADSSDNSHYFIKVHCPWAVLTKGAALLKMRKRIRVEKDVDSNIFAEASCLRCCLPSSKYVPFEESEDYFTAIFNPQKLESFDIRDEETFFTNAERSLITKMMLDMTEYRTQDAKMNYCIHVGIESLLRHKVYAGAFPLHEGSLPDRCEADMFIGADKDRLRLYEVWAKPKNCFSFQPLDLIRKYYGEKIAMYFSWLGLYTMLLIPAAAFGLAVFLYGLITLPDSESAKDICSASGPEYIMCPECDQLCGYHNLSNSCIFARLTHVFDNRATIAMAVFMSAWALCFLEFWKRQQAELQYDWDVADFELNESVRPEFSIKIKTTRVNPVTKSRESYLTWYGWFVRRCTSLSVVLFMVCTVIAAMFGVLVYRLAVVLALYSTDKETVKSNARLITSVTASLINLVICIVMSKVYERIAVALTNLEAHRTFSSHEDSYTLKMIVFQFINFYGSIFYIAFFKGSFIDRPGRKDMYLFNKYREDQCDPAGCITDLTIQLAIIMVGKQALNAFIQLIIPLLMKCFRSNDVRNQQIYMRWEQDNDLTSLGPLGLFQEYLSMVIQFGFTTIFVASFPLAPVFALINNVIELRLDAYKLIKFYQRPAAYKAQDIGAWFNIMKFFAFVAVITNAFIIGWTSDLIPKIVYSVQHGGSQVGYINDSLAVFNTSDFADGTGPSHGATLYPTCRYPGYRYGPEHPDKYDYTSQYWLVFCARLAFVIVFEHACIALMLIVTAVIPDVSGRVKRLRVYERELNYRGAFDESFTESRNRREELHRFIQNFDVGIIGGGGSDDVGGGGSGSGHGLMPLGFGPGGDMSDGGSENIALDVQ